jgi:hypothetical protein
MNALLEQLKTYFTSTAGMISAAIAAALAAAVTAAMSPLGGTLRDMIWTEEITVDDHITVTETKSERLTFVIADKARGTGLSGGRVVLHPPDDGAVVLHGPRSFSYPAADGAITAAPEGVTIEGRLPGKSRIVVTIDTNRGRHFKGQLEVETIATRPIPTNLNFSTTDWVIVLNGREGKLTIEEDPSHRFAGTAELEDGARYSVKGFRDGEAFQAKFRLPGSSAAGPVAFKIDGHYCQKGDWLVVNAKVTTYRDGVPTPNPVPLRSISQRCPKFPEALADLEGDGAFMASVATK